MIARIVARRIGRKAAGGSMFKALVHRQNHHFPGTGQSAMIKHTSQIRANPKVLARVPAQNFSNSFVHFLTLFHSSSREVRHRPCGRLTSIVPRGESWTYYYTAKFAEKEQATMQNAAFLTHSPRQTRP